MRPDELNEIESGENPFELSAQGLARVKAHLESDLFDFAWFVFGFRDLSPTLHGELATLLSRWGSPPLRRLMIQIPRNFFKTSLCTIANSLWQIVREPDCPIAIFNEKQDNAAMWVRTIRDTAQASPLFLALWGKDLMPPGKAGPKDARTTPRWWKWNDDEIMFQRSTVQPEASISALGIGSASAGRHWPKLIFDDLISEDARDSPTIMESAKRWVDTAKYLERPALQGQVLTACTTWAYDDVYAHMLRSQDYQIYRRSALESVDGEPDVLGQSIFPEMFSTEVLLQQHEDDDFGFMAQMQNVPRAGRDRSFDPKWFRWGQVTGDPERPRFIIDTKHYDSTITGEVRIRETPPPSVPIAMMNKAILLDPAPTEPNEIKRERRARNGLVVVGRDPWGRWFLLDCWASRADPLAVIDQIFTMCDRWGTHVVGIEEVNFSKLYRYWLLQRSQARGQMLHVLRMKPGKKDKGTRITAQVPAFRSGLVYMNQDTCKPIARELAEYPNGTTVDLIDALSYKDQHIMRPETLEEVTEKRMIQRRRRTDGRSQVCGY